jgi:hypothetical protein
MSKAAGAKPGESATRTQHSYPIGPEWAAYRLPFPGMSGISPRDVGIVFEGEPDGGANPPAGNPDPPKPPEPPKPPAKGDDDPELGDAGKEAIRRERENAKREKDRADDLQKQLDDAAAANQTDQEKAIADARKEATKATATEYEGKIRASEVRSALRAAGITNEKTLALAVNAPEFASLKVEDDGSVTDIDKTVESFKKDYPEMFAKAAPAAGVTRGAQAGNESDRPKTLSDAIAARVGVTA